MYDCHRYWSDLPVAWEGELAAAADVCFAASEGLVDRLSPCNENIALLPNGVNYPLFCRELVDTPPELTDLTDKPVLGFIGSLRSDLDVTPLLLAADSHPEWTILMVGPAEPSVYLPQLEARENIRLLGKRPLVELPDYLSCCRVCVQLLRTREEDSDVIPARVYEYLAAGKPVVSMLWRHQQEEFPDVIRPARTAEEFVTQCETALTEDPTELLRRRRDYGLRRRMGCPRAGDHPYFRNQRPVLTPASFGLWISPLSLYNCISLRNSPFTLAFGQIFR